MEVIIGHNRYLATPSDYPAQELNQLAEVNVKLGDRFKNIVVACNFAQQRDIIEDTPRIVIANRVYDLTLQRGIVRSADGEIIADLEPLQDAKLGEINTAIIRRVKIRNQDYVTVPRAARDPNEMHMRANYTIVTMVICLLAVVAIEYRMHIIVKHEYHNGGLKIEGLTAHSVMRVFMCMVSMATVAVVGV